VIVGYSKYNLEILIRENINSNVKYLTAYLHNITLKINLNIFLIDIFTHNNSKTFIRYKNNLIECSLFIIFFLTHKI